MQIKYFSWVKEQIGVDAENITINDNLSDHILKELNTIQDELFESAKKKHNEMIHRIEDYNELCSKLNSEGGFVKSVWCGNRECEDKIKDKTGADIRLIEDEIIDSACIVCRKNATNAVYFAKSY